MKRLMLGLLAAWLVALAQTAPLYTVTTIAGRGKLAYPGDGLAATSVSLFEPERVAYDSAGNLYFTEGYYQRVFRVTTAGILSVVAGNGESGFGGDGGPATAAVLEAPEGVAVGADGQVYVGSLYRIRRVSTDGRIRTIAGSGERGYAGDGGPATAARMDTPAAMVVDASNNVYFADGENHVVRRASAAGVITTVAGTGVAGFSGDGGPARSAQLNGPDGLALDAAGNLYIADSENYRVRRVDPQGVITTYAGNGEFGYAGDNGPPTAARLTRPRGLAVTPDGLFIADVNFGRVRRVAPNGLIYTACATRMVDIAASPAGHFAIIDNVSRMIQRLTLSCDITPLAGLAWTTALGDGGPATAAVLLTPLSLGVDGAGNVFFADHSDQRVRRIGTDGVIRTVAGNGEGGYSGDGGLATETSLNQPNGLAVDATGSIFVTCNDRVRRIEPSGRITTFAGGGQLGYGGDGGPAINARINFPRGLAVDSGGNLYIADTSNHRVRRVERAGTITTIAGNGEPGYFGNGIAATSARLNFPSGVAVDASGSVYIADIDNHRVRKVSLGGVITDFAGTGERGHDGDGGPALQARLDFPRSVAVDGAGNVFIASYRYVRRVAPNGVIWTVAGNGEVAFSGDGNVATQAGMFPSRLAADGAGRVYLSDTANYRIRRLDPVQILAAGVVNGATFLGGPVAPGEILAVFGVDLGPAELVRGAFDATGRLATTLADVQITFDGAAAPLLYVSAGQAGPIVPYSVAGKTSTVMQVSYRGRKTNAVTLAVAEASPGIVTLAGSGRGAAAVFNQDGTLNAAANPAERGSIIVFWATGEGQTDPAGVDGKLATEVFPKPLLPVAVTVGGVDAEVLYARAAPWMVAGAMQVNARVAADTPAGPAVPIRVKVGNHTSPEGVTVAIR